MEHPELRAARAALAMREAGLAIAETVLSAMNRVVPGEPLRVKSKITLGVEEARQRVAHLEAWAPD